MTPNFKAFVVLILTLLLCVGAFAAPLQGPGQSYAIASTAVSQPSVVPTQPEAAPMPLKVDTEVSTVLVVKETPTWVWWLVGVLGFALAAAGYFVFCLLNFVGSVASMFSRR